MRGIGHVILRNLFIISISKNSSDVLRILLAHGLFKCYFEYRQIGKVEVGCG